MSLHIQTGSFTLSTSVRRAACGLAVAFGAFLLASCGAGPQPPGATPTMASGTGRSTITILWPSASRLIPLASQSIRASYYRGTTLLQSQLLPRPSTGGATTATFSELPVGTLTFTATAYPNADGTGVPQATASTQVTIRSGQNTPVSVSMVSTVDHLELSPTNPLVPVGSSLALNLVAKDASGAIVLLSPSKINWSTQDATVARVDSGGTITGVGAGSTAVTATDTESNKSVGLTAFVAAPATYHESGRLRSLILSDFNRDGHLDIAADSIDLGAAGVLLGKGNGLFQPPVNYPIGSQPTLFAAGDLNGDGIPDLLAADSASGAIGVLLGNGDGTFQPLHTYPANSGATFDMTLAVGDVNGDGKLDVVFTNFGGGNVGVLLGNGDGSFGAPQFFPSGGTPDSVTVGDFNGDGKLDIAATDPAGGQINVLLGNGDGTFGPPTHYNTAHGAYYVVTRDVNKDGHLDLIVVNDGTGLVSVLLGRGDGTFQNAVNYPVQTQPTSAAIGDLNGDGALDIVTSNSQAGSISVLLGNGDGTFQQARNFPVTPNPFGVALGDFNEDGRLDAAVVDLFNNTVTVLPGRGDGSFIGP